MTLRPIFKILSQLTLTLAFLFAVPASHAADPLLGTWRAVDNSNGGTQSFIELYMNGDQMQGRIVAIKSSDGASLDPICSYCSGVLANKKVVGAVFISGLTKSGSKWTGGKVIDLRPGPTQGATANCELELINGKARIFGYLWFRVLGGSDYWDQVSTIPPWGRPQLSHLTIFTQPIHPTTARPAPTPSE
jgi:uncharacterized protein (DUF2147 family)